MFDWLSPSLGTVALSTVVVCIAFWLVCGGYACMLSHSTLAVPQFGRHGLIALHLVNLNLVDTLFSENNIGLAAFCFTLHSIRCLRAACLAALGGL